MTEPGSPPRPRPRNSGLYIVIGLLVTLVGVLAIVVVLLLTGSPGGLVSATATPAGASEIALASPEPGTSPGGSEAAGSPTAGAPTSGLTAPAPTTRPATTSAPATPHPSTTATQPPKTAAPAATPKPAITSFSGPSSKATCGGFVTVHLTWTTTNISGVRLSIDPPTAAGAYNYGYGDYPANGSADLPFACDPPNHDDVGYYHLYVLTIHTSTFSSYRFIKIYA
jgi:hypothetical protein